MSQRAPYNPFEVLMLHHTCDDVNVIASAYQSRLLKCKPDVAGNLYTPEFQLVQRAYNDVIKYISKKNQQQQPRSYTPQSPAQPQQGTRSYFQPQQSLQPQRTIQQPVTEPQRRPPPPEIRNPFGKRTYDKDTFNALFEISKQRQQALNPNENQQEELSAFDAIDNSDLACTSIVEGNGLIMFKDPKTLSSQRWGDMRELEKDAETAVLVTLDDVDQTELGHVKQKVTAGQTLVTEAQQQRFRQSYLNQELPRNTLPIHKSKEELYKQQVQRIKREEEEARRYIEQQLQQNPSLYPEYTRQRFQRGELDRFRTD